LEEDRQANKPAFFVLGEYLLPIGGIIITKEQIYEMKVMIRMITADTNKN